MVGRYNDYNCHVVGIVIICCLFTAFTTVTTSNIPNTELEQVFPLSLIYCKDVGEIGLKRITEEIDKHFLEIVLNGMIWKGRRLQVRVMYIIGDNLSQNQVCGWTRSWSQGKCCRYCHYIIADFPRLHGGHLCRKQQRYFAARLYYCTRNRFDISIYRAKDKHLVFRFESWQSS